MTTIKKILTTSLVLCTGLFADSPTYNTSNGNLCFKTRNVMYPVKDVFESLKSTLMQSNLNIVTVTKKDGVLLAKGSQINDDEDTVTSITVTVSFKPINDGNSTNVKLIANYDTREKQNDSGQIGAAGISLPIPVPFTGKYIMSGSGSIDDSLWYQGFFNSLDKLLFENEIKYGKTLEEIKAEQERLAKEKAEQERLAKEKAEQERLAKEKAEQERLAKEKAEQERLAKEKAEQERLAKEKAEQEKVVKEQPKQEVIEPKKEEVTKTVVEKKVEETTTTQTVVKEVPKN